MSDWQPRLAAEHVGAGGVAEFPEGPAADAEAQALLDRKLAQSRITRDEHAAMSRQLRQAACAQQELFDAWRDKPPQELAEHVLRTEFGRMCIAVHSHKTMRTDDPAGPYTAYFISVECGSGSGSSWTLKRRYSDFHALHKATRRDAKLAGLPFPPKKWMGGLSDDDKVARRAGLHAFMNEALEATSGLLLPTLQEVRGPSFLLLLLLLLPPPPPPPIPLLVVMLLLLLLLLLMMMRADMRSCLLPTTCETDCSVHRIQAELRAAVFVWWRRCLCTADAVCVRVYRSRLEHVLTCRGSCARLHAAPCCAACAKPLELGRHNVTCDSQLTAHSSQSFLCNQPARAADCGSERARKLT